MWFLGSPDKIKVALTIKNPGPVDVNFSELDEQEQKKVLLGLKNRILECDSSFEDLYKIYKAVQVKQVEEVEKTEEVRRFLERQQEREEENKILKVEAQYQKRKDKIRDRSAYLTNKSNKAIQSALSKENDIDMFRAMLDLENMRKRPRVSVVNYLQEHIRKFEAQIIASIENDKRQIRGLPRGEDFIIIEDDGEEIELVIDNSPENERMLGEPI